MADWAGGGDLTREFAALWSCQGFCREDRGFLLGLTFSCWLSDVLSVILFFWTKCIFLKERLSLLNLHCPHKEVYWDDDRKLQKWWVLIEEWTNIKLSCYSLYCRGNHLWIHWARKIFWSLWSYLWPGAFWKWWCGKIWITLYATGWANVDCGGRSTQWKW